MSDSDDEEEDSDDDLEVEELGSDEDEIDDEGMQYIEKLQKTRQSMEAGDDDVSFHVTYHLCNLFGLGFGLLTSGLMNRLRNHHFT